MYEHEPQFIVDRYDEKYGVKGYYVVDTLINGITGGRGDDTGVDSEGNGFERNGELESF